MSDFWLPVIIVGFITTFLFKGGFVMFKLTKPFPKIIEEFLDYVPAAAMFSIAGANAIFMQENGDLIISPIEILAAIVTLIVAWTSKNLFLTLACGMGSIWIIDITIKI